MKASTVIYWIFLGTVLALLSCSKTNPGKRGKNFKFISGTWIDKESLALQFIEFQSPNRGRFGNFSKQLKTYSPFSYTLADSTFIMRFDEPTVHTESAHRLSIIDEDIITISDMTLIPENPDKTYLRRKLVTERKGDTIVIDESELYYDLDNDFSLQIDSLLGDSRCPEGVTCVWQGNAQVRFNLVVQGNYQYFFTLNTHDGPRFPSDTLINDIDFQLVRVEPYPQFNSPINLDTSVRVKLLAIPKN